mgnify:CR=1 FL=1
MIITIQIGNKIFVISLYPKCYHIDKLRIVYAKRIPSIKNLYKETHCAANTSPAVWGFILHIIFSILDSRRVHEVLSLSVELYPYKVRYWLHSPTAPGGELYNLTSVPRYICVTVSNGDIAINTFDLDFK